MLKPKVLLVTILTTSMLALAPAAEAVSYVEIDVSDVTVPYGGCRDAVIDVYGDWETDVHNDIEIDIYDPAGDFYDEGFFQDDTDGQVRYRTTLCGDYDLEGRYAVDVTATGYDENYEVTSSVQSSSSFTFREKDRKNSRLRLGVRRVNHGKYKWLAVAKLTRAGKVYRHHPVCAEIKYDGGWLSIDCTKTNRRGLVGWEFKPNRLRWRYHFEGNATTKPSATRTFRTPRPGNARLVSERVADSDPATAYDVLRRR